MTNTRCASPTVVDELAQANQKLAFILASITDAYFALDERWRFREINPVAERLVFDRPADELIGKVIWDELPQTVGSEFHRQYLLAAAEGRPVHFEARSRVVDRWFEAHAYPRDGGLEVYLRDITDRKQAEQQLYETSQRLRLHVENAPLAVVEWDPRFVVTRWAGEAREIFGWTAQEMLGKPIDGIQWIYEEDAPKVAAVMDALVSGKVSRSTCANRNYRKDGSVIHCEWYNSGLRDASGQLVSVLSMALDVTGRRQAEEALKAAKHAAEEANAAKDQFLAIISHELRTPLTPVLAVASVLEKDDALPRQAQADMAMIRRNVELEARLIDDLIDLTRITRGNLELYTRTVDLGAVVREAVEICTADIRAKRLHLSLNAPAGDCYVRGDWSRLRQVFWNLLKNAVKFTPAGGTIGIRCVCDSARAAVEIQDSGIGIEPEALQRLFTAFEQGGQSVRREFGGLGLGLAISRALVELQGGSISAFSGGRNQGATFRVELPMVSLPSMEPAAPAPRKEAAPSACLRILLVEDHPDTARIMRKLLTADGHEVQVAGDVASAIEAARTAEFDLLISDLGLPDGNGDDVMRAIREMGRPMKGIALSGFGRDEDIARTREAGFVEHLTKPIDFSRLQSTIARVR